MSPVCPLYMLSFVLVCLAAIRPCLLCLGLVVYIGFDLPGLYEVYSSIDQMGGGASDWLTDKRNTFLKIFFSALQQYDDIDIP